MINHVIIRQLTTSPPAMGKRKAKPNNLTKIDPSTLTPKPQATSQHAAHDGRRVTAAVNPTRSTPLDDPDIFSADTLTFSDDYPGDESGNDGVSGEYDGAQVCPFHPVLFSMCDNSFLPGQPAPAIQG